MKEIAQHQASGVFLQPPTIKSNGVRLVGKAAASRFPPILSSSPGHSGTYIFFSHFVGLLPVVQV